MSVRKVIVHRRPPHISYHVGRDLLVFAVSLVFAYLIIESDIVPYLAQELGRWSLLAVFVSGFFFTSMVTVAPAAVALAEFAQTLPLIQVAALGAAGSVLADLILFRLVRDHVAADISFLLKHSGLKRLKALHQTRLTRRTLSVLGALFIISPLPDEIGVALMGGSRMSTGRFILIAYVMHFFGIALIGAVARGLMW